VAAVAASLALALISELLIGAWCILCMVSWSISLATLVAAGLACRGAGPVAAVRADLGALAAMPRRSSAAIVAGLLALLALASWYPRYWERARAVDVLTRPLPNTGAVLPPVGPLRDPAEGAVVYSDYECPYCLVAHGELKVVLTRRPDIKVVKRHFPLDQACNPAIKRPMHQNACEYARAAICAEAQGHFAAMDDALFENQRSRRPVEEVARGLGLDLARFQACLAAPETAARLQADIAAATKDGIKATPTYVVGGVQYAGRLPVEIFAPARGGH
jgi:predicted DsbA family dithiol-disulfide isomerase